MTYLNPRDVSELKLRKVLLAGLAFFLAMAIGYWGFGEYRERRCERIGGTWVAKGKTCQR